MRAAVVLLIIVVNAGFFFAYRDYQQQQNTTAQMSRQIDDLNARLQKLQNDDNLLRYQLATVQEENYKLKGYNDELKKALDTAKATGKVPLILPFPPK